MRRTRTTLAALAGLTILTAAVALPMTTAPDDYETIPPRHRDVEVKLRASSITIAKAVDVATKLTGGVAESAMFRTDADGRTLIDVTVYASGTKRVISLDSEVGSMVADETKSRFPGAPVSGDWVETDSGLKYYDIVEGTGATPPNASTTVRVHYSGWLVDGTQFDSSVERGQPATFPLDRVIGGWTEGVGSMKVGGKRKLIIPYNLAYGPNGRGPTIPPRATLIFDVELLDIIN